MKKVCNLIVLLFISTLTFGATIPESCTKAEKELIKELVKKEKRELIEVRKGSHTNWKAVAEFVNRIYVINDASIESIWVLGDEDWIQLKNLDESINHTNNMAAYVFNFAENQPGNQRIEIVPVTGTPTWTLYYDFSFFDPTINATIYVHDDAIVGIGEDFVFYEDSLDIFFFSFLPCEEESK
jgi:hypothetical protein